MNANKETNQGNLNDLSAYLILQDQEEMNLIQNFLPVSLYA